MNKAELIKKIQNKEIKAFESVYNVYRLDEAENGIPEKHKGIREIIKVSKTGIIELKNNGKNLRSWEQKQTIWLNEKPASLMEITDKELICYDPFIRELNEQELAIYAKWNEITSTERYKKDLEYDLLADYNGTYYEKKRFFENAGFGYLVDGKKHGCLYVSVNDPKHVMDFSKRGRKATIYNLIYNL